MKLSGLDFADEDGVYDDEENPAFALLRKQTGLKSLMLGPNTYWRDIQSSMLAENKEHLPFSLEKLVACLYAGSVDLVNALLRSSAASLRTLVSSIMTRNP